MTRGSKLDSGGWNRRFGWVALLVIAGLYGLLAVASHAQDVRFGARVAAILELDEELGALEAIVSEVEDLERGIDRTRHEAAVLRELEWARDCPAAVFDVVHREASDGLWIQRIDLDGRRLRVQARSWSDEDGAEYLQRLDRSAVLDRVELLFIRYHRINAGRQPERFELNADVPCMPRDR